MSAQRLTDNQIAAALRAHLPAHARADVRMRIAAEVSTARQRHPLPQILAPLFDADRDARRRAVLLVAAALLAVGVVAATVVGTLLRRDDPVRITVDPAVDAPGFVEQAFAAHRLLPPMALVASTTDDGSVDTHRFYVNALGHLRHDCCGGAIFIIGGASGGSTNEDATGNPVWLLGVGGDPAALPGFELATYSWFSTPSCELGWRYVGPERLVDRPAHHLACPLDAQGEVERPDMELWLDAELGIVLQSKISVIQMGQNGQPVAAIRSELVVQSIELAEPDPALFEPPHDLRLMSLAEYTCGYDPQSCEAAATPPSTAVPATTPLPAGDAPEPPDVPALVASTLQSYAGLPAMSIVIEDRGSYGGVVRRFTDGTWLREERGGGPNDAEPPVITLGIREGGYETWYLDDGTTEWRRLGDFTPPPFIGGFTLGLSQRCAAGWEYLGLDVLLGSEAWHVGCDRDEFWIDRERLLVVRKFVVPDALHFEFEIQTVLSVELGPQPPELFELPEDAVIVGGDR